MALKISLNLTLPDVDNPIQTGDTTHRRNCLHLADLLKKLASGNLPGVAGTTTLDMRTSGASASAYLTASSASGSVGATIGGTTVTATASGGDNPSLALIKAAINANTTVNKWVVASIAGLATASEYVTLSGTSGTLTVTINGTGVSVTHNTDDDTDGAALATAINASTRRNLITASYNAGNNRLTITANSAGSAGNAITLAVTGTGLTANGATLSGGTDKCVVTSLVPGVVGNSISFVASGTGITASGARLSGGTESRVSYSL
jgi:hypothetical protein